MVEKTTDHHVGLNLISSIVLAEKASPFSGHVTSMNRRNKYLGEVGLNLTKV